MNFYGVREVLPNISHHQNDSKIRAQKICEDLQLNIIQQNNGKFWFFIWQFSIGASVKNPFVFERKKAGNMVWNQQGLTISSLWHCSRPHQHVDWKMTLCLITLAREVCSSFVVLMKAWGGTQIVSGKQGWVIKLQAAAELEASDTAEPDNDGGTWDVLDKRAWSDGKGACELVICCSRETSSDWGVR